MSHPETTKTLEMRVVELENRLKALQPGPVDLSPEELKVYNKVSATIAKYYRCINECICGPCNCDPIWVSASLINSIRLAQMAGVVSPELANTVTKDVAHNVAQLG